MFVINPCSERYSVLRGSWFKSDKRSSGTFIVLSFNAAPRAERTLTLNDNVNVSARTFNLLTRSSRYSSWFRKQLYQEDCFQSFHKRYYISPSRQRKPDVAHLISSMAHLLFEQRTTYLSAPILNDLRQVLIRLVSLRCRLFGSALLATYSSLAYHTQARSSL